jgi:hypothetical protein
MRVAVMSSPPLAEDTWPVVRTPLARREGTRSLARVPLKHVPNQDLTTDAGGASQGSTTTKEAIGMTTPSIEHLAV